MFQKEELFHGDLWFLTGPRGVFFSVIAKLFFFLIISHLTVLKGPEEPAGFQREVIQRILGLEEPEGDESCSGVRDESTIVSPLFFL